MPTTQSAHTENLHSQPLQVQRLLSQKDKLENARIDQVTMTTDLQPGEAIIKVERFALTTNNVTYAAFGDAMGYWKFFPTGLESWGHMPVWGVGTVVASAADGIAVGDRFFGYYPIATHLKVLADKISPRGFVEVTNYRQKLPAAYNYYTNYNDINPESAASDYQMLLRPLFLTSYMLADYLLDSDFFQAQQVIISGASSKTAYGSAFCFSDQVEANLIGLTSARNKTFVEGLGCYQQVVTYDQLETTNPTVPTLYIDFSGDIDLRKRIHEHFGDNLVYDCYAGSASNLEFLEESTKGSSKTQFFFAAPHYRKRVAELGAKEVLTGMDTKQNEFIETLRDPQNPWLTLHINKGFEAAADVVCKLCRNEVSAEAGHVVVLP